MVYRECNYDFERQDIELELTPRALEVHETPKTFRRTAVPESGETFCLFHTPESCMREIKTTKYFNLVLIYFLNKIIYL